ncbi:MAG: hypothetical protein NTZ14_11575 [Hyphomicrobiales bacterium]|nr:hypothetical protein [Hyphomicrobiales bacterium]
MADDDDLTGSLTRQTVMLTQLGGLTRPFGRSLTEAFSKGIVEGKRFEDIRTSIALRLSDTALKQSLKPLETESGLIGQGLYSQGGLFCGGAYELTIHAAGAPKRVLRSGTPSLIYPTALELADFGASQSVLDIGPAQVSDAVGAGPMGRATIPVR